MTLAYLERDILATFAYDGSNLTHAAYPTAQQTLCGVLLKRVRQVASELPSCETCASTARVYRRIDQSAPAVWFTPMLERSSS